MNDANKCRLEAVSSGKELIDCSRRFFDGLKDPRDDRGKRHQIVDVVLLSLIAILCGCDSAEDIEDWADLKRDWYKDWFDAKHGTPSQDTILRVLEILNPEEFVKAVGEWLDALRGNATGQVALDGKSLRGSLDASNGRGTVHIISAWMCDAGLVLGQLKTDEKSNEITAIPILLKMLNLAGCLVSIDAAGCQRAIAKQIVEGQGDYLLAVKENQPTLLRDLDNLFSQGRDERRRSVDELARPRLQQKRSTDGGHGRIEERCAYVTEDLDWLTTGEQWPGLVCAIMLECSRTDSTSGRTEKSRRYYISSRANLDASAALEAIRNHWSVENNLHWVLDVCFGEDRSRIRARAAAENFSALRRIALSMLKSVDPPARGRKSMKHRRRACDNRHDYLCHVLAAGRV